MLTSQPVIKSTGRQDIDPLKFAAGDKFLVSGHKTRSGAGDRRAEHRQEGYNRSVGLLYPGPPQQPMATAQEIEKANEALPLVDQLWLYPGLPHLIGSAPEELNCQRLAVEEFFRDDSPDDAIYDSTEGW